MLWEDCAPRGRRTRFTPPSARACSRCLRPEALRQKGKDPVPHVDDVARRQICVALAPVADQLHILALAMQRSKQPLGLVHIYEVQIPMDAQTRGFDMDRLEQRTDLDVTIGLEPRRPPTPTIPT